MRAGRAARRAAPAIARSRRYASWVTTDLRRCYQVMACDDRAPLDAWMRRWADLVDFEVHPVLTSPEASAAVADLAFAPGRAPSG